MKKLFPFFLLTLIVSAIYYKLFFFGKIPFPGDLLIVSYSPWLDYYKFPVQNPLISDVFSQFFLWKYLSLESFKNWQWPLWNPYSFMGTPLLATYHSATLYPLNILLLLPKYLGWGLYIYSQTLIAALTFYLFASLSVRSKLAGLIGAVIFSLGGLMATWLELGTAGHAIAWLPLALYAVSKFIIERKFRFVFLLILSLSAVILAGNAQITTYTFIVVSSYCLWFCWGNKNKTIKTTILFLAFFGSVGLTALQLLPSFDLLSNSIRQADSYTQDANFGLLNIKDGLKFFIPDYFGNTVTRNYWGTLNYSETSGFLGILSLPLLIYAVIKIRSKDILFFSLLFLFSLIAAFDNPLSQAFYNLKIPLLTSSYASRMLFVVLFSTGMISVLAIDHILKHHDFPFLRKTVLWSWAAIIGIIGGTLLTYFYIGEIIAWAPNGQYLKFYLNNYDYALRNFLIAAKNSLVPLAFTSILLLFSLIINRIKSKHSTKLTIFFSVFLILMILDLGRYFLKFNPFVPNNLIFPKTPSLEFLQKQKGLFRTGREYAEVLPPNTWTAYQLYSIEGYDPIYLSRYAKFMHFLNGGDIRFGTTGRYAEVASGYQSPYLDAANVKYFIAILRDRYGQIPGDLLNYKFKETDLKVVFQDRSSAVLENPHAKDRAYLAKKIIKASTKEIGDKFMEDKSFNPKETGMLSNDLKISTVSGQGSVTTTFYSPNIVKVKTDTADDEVLILADQYETGWQATIDDKPTDISPVNLIFRAIKIPAGSHEVVFKYWPKSFDAGLKISLASLLSIILISVFTIKIRRF